MLSHRRGAELYGRYFLLMELLCSEFKHDKVEFIFSNKQLRDALFVKTDSKLKHFFDLLDALNTSFGKSPVKIYQTENTFWTIETSIVLDLMGKSFKRTRQGSVTDASKKKEKEEEKDKDKEKEKSAFLNNASKIDFQFYMDSWNNLFRDVLPEIKMLTLKRKKMIRTMLKTYPDFDLDIYAARIKSSSFLLGSTNWRANFDWCMKQDNYLKVIEGRYDNKKSTLDQQEEAFLNG